VEQDGWRVSAGQPEVDRSGMALRGPYQAVPDLEAPLSRSMDDLS
jgi:hypothetical protein